MRKREWALIVSVIACLIYLQQVVVETAFAYYMHVNAESATTPAPLGPDIGHCFDDDVDLWDCIRNKEERDDPES